MNKETQDLLFELLKDERVLSSERQQKRNSEAYSRLILSEAKKIQRRQKRKHLILMQKINEKS